MRIASGRAALLGVLVAAVGGCNGTEPARPARIEAAAGVFPQVANVGAAVPIAPSVHVTDSQGQNMGNVSVVFAITAGGGTVIPATLATDANGIATVAGWILGPTVGTNLLSASVAGLPPVVFTAQGVAPAPPPPPGVPPGVLRRISGLSGRPFGVRVLSGNIAYVTRQDVSLATRIDASTGQIGASVLTGNDPGEIIFDATGAFGYTPNVLGASVSIVNMANHTLVQLVPVTGSPYRVVMSPDGARVYVSADDGKVSVLQTGARSISGAFTLSGGLNGMAISADGTTLYVSSTSGGVYRVDAATGQVLASASTGGKGQELVLSPHSTGKPTDIYIANESGWVDVLDATTLAQKQRVTALGAFGMALSPDGTRLFVSAPAYGLVYVFRRSDMAGVITHNVGGMPRRIAFTADGNALVANEGNWVDVIP
jgi:DNA-binding beta-propeller fold protein YncE